jgi:hypothetical protein
MPTYAVGQRLTAALLQELADLIEDSTVSAAVTADSATVTTTETTTITLVAAVEAGAVYQISSYARISSSVAGDVVTTRIREDTSVGAQIQGGQVECSTTSTTGYSNSLSTEFTAASTGNKTFVFTIVRGGGTGNIIHRAAATAPGYLTCRLKSGA